MPVWHELTKPWRESGRLQVIGIAQEQHPERCALFAQWHGIDWPILWDPLNLTGARAVPNLFAIDEMGFVRAVGPDPETFEADFLGATFTTLPFEPVNRPWVREELLDPDASSGSLMDSQLRAYAQLLWGGEPVLDAAIAALEELDPQVASAEQRFRLGVAFRMRADSPRARPGDFQRALDQWTRALAAEPNQYIWRRRLQQYGPRLDKPYPFYDWVERARREVRARGEEPVELPAALTGAEIAGAIREFPSGEAADEPDPEGRIQRDERGLLQVESAVAFDTGPDRRGGGPVARVHLSLRPNADLDAHWSNEAEPLRVWIELPDGWRAERRLLINPNPPVEISDEVRRLELEVRLPEDVQGEQLLRGYALFNACEGAGGQCLFRRLDLSVPIRPPR